MQTLNNSEVLLNIPQDAAVFQHLVWLQQKEWKVKQWFEGAIKVAVDEKYSKMENRKTKPHTSPTPQSPKRTALVSAAAIYPMMPLGSSEMHPLVTLQVGLH